MLFNFTKTATNAACKQTVVCALPKSVQLSEQPPEHFSITVHFNFTVTSAQFLAGSTMEGMHRCYISEWPAEEHIKMSASVLAS